MNTDHAISTLAVYATRYALGRMSYAPSDVCNILVDQWTKVSKQDRRVILKEIAIYMARHGQYSLIPPDPDDIREVWEQTYRTLYERGEAK